MKEEEGIEYKLNSRSITTFISSTLCLSQEVAIRNAGGKKKTLKNKKIWAICTW